MDTIIEQLKTARQSLGMKQFELGKKLGLPQSHISKIESGQNDPRLSTIEDMARILEHELMIIPRQMIPHINALLRGGETKKPRWTLDDEAGL
ncbi:MAG: helix-turn-helix transcriptional regulator [Rickettsiales bacterium]|jgi:HTH-type transcriptional regulator/antitoxin HipB